MQKHMPNKKNTRLGKRFIATVLILSVLATTMLSLGATAVTGLAMGENPLDMVGTSIYKKIDMSTITGEGGDPEEITGAASAAARKKMWYEYLTYSSNPVGMVPLDNDYRALFFDPYDYSNSLVMELDETMTDWSSANALTTSYTTGNSFSEAYGDGSTTQTSVQAQKGTDTSWGQSSGWSNTNTNNWSSTWNKSESITNSNSSTSTWSNSITGTMTASQEASLSSTTKVGVSTEVSTEAGANVGVASAKVGTKIGTSVEESITVGAKFGLTESVSTGNTHGGSDTKSSSLQNGYSVGGSEGGSDSHSENFTENQSWSKVADRLTSSTGTSTSFNRTWSNNDSMTISTTYNATYFNESGSPLQWKIVKYKVMMPMYYIVQRKVGDEWINVGEDFCLLTTLQGTCRSWIENNVVYYEHWGTGEKVTWNDFWSGFFTKEGLAAAYQNKLYPDNK